MLFIGQERSKEKKALAAEPCCVSDSNCASARGVVAQFAQIEFLIRTTTPAGWTPLFTPSLFPGGRWHTANHPITPKVVWNACKKAAQRADLQNRVHPHTLRHYSASRTITE